MFPFSRRPRKARSRRRGTLARPDSLTSTNRGLELLEQRQLLAVDPVLAGLVSTLELAAESAAPHEAHTSSASARPLASTLGVAMAPSNKAEPATVLSADETASLFGAALTRPLSSDGAPFGAAAATVSLPFADNFNRPDNSPLSSAWLERMGDLRIVGNHLVNASNRQALATLNGVWQANVSISLDYNLQSAEVERSVGIIARYSGPGDSNYYMARVMKQGGSYTAEIWVNLGGNYTPLSSVSTSHASGRLRFNVYGSRLDLYINGVLLTSVTNDRVTIGTLGIRQTGGFSDNFLAEIASPPPTTNVTLPFTDHFDRPDSSFIGSNWTERIGDVRLQGGKLALNTNGTAIVTLNGPIAADVSVSADVDLTRQASANSSLGLLARWSGPGDSNAYMARLFRTVDDRYFVQIWRNPGMGWEFLSQAQVSSGSGRLRFDVIGTSLRAYWNNTLVVTTTDSIIRRAGMVGFRHAGGLAGLFEAHVAR